MQTEFKVLHVATAISWRGGEQQVAYLVEELNKLGIRQYVLCAVDSAMEEYCIAHNIPFFTSKKRSALDLSFSQKISRLCRSNSIDIVHTHDSHAHSFAVYSSVLFGNKAKIVVSRRVDFPVSGNPLSRFKYNFRGVKRILCVSEKIREITSLAVRDTTRLKTVHDGIDITKFDGRKNNGKLHREYNVPENVRIVANVAALAPHKDYYTFVDTAEILLKQRNDIIFLVIGDGPEKESIERYIAGKSLSAKIIMTGFRKDVPEIFPELDVMLVTSETEGLGTSILDAFACSVPVVATNAGGIPEIVINEKTGLLVPVKDSRALAIEVNRLLDEKNLRQQLITGALEYVKHFTKQAMAEKTLREYKSLYR